VLIRLARRRGDLLAVVPLVAFALLASLTTGKQEPPEPYEPPPYRLVPSPAGAWGDPGCLHAPARHQARRRDAVTQDR
jgi:hypothetical protein